MEVRKCCGCGKTHPLTLEFFSSAKRHGVVGYAYKCKACVREAYQENKLSENIRRKRWYEKNREKIRLRRKWENLTPEKLAAVKAQSHASYWKNAEKARAATSKWREKNPEKVKQMRAKYQGTEKDLAQRKHRRKTLTDSYVREQIVRRSSRKIDIPQELVDAKRFQLLITRKIKELEG